MRVVYLNPSGETGGAERSLLDFLASLRQARPAWELHLVLSAAGPLVALAEQLGVRVRVLEFPRAIARLGDSSRRASMLLRMLRAVPVVFTYCSQLARMLRELAPDVVHSNGFKMHLLGALCVPPRAQQVWHVHDYVSRRPAMARLLRVFNSRVSMRIANSQSVAQDLRQMLPGALTVIPNGIDLHRFQPEGNKAELDAPPGTLRVVLPCTFARWKGHEVFLRALSLVCPQARVRGFIVGGPIYRTAGSQYALEELQNLARELSVDVCFTGFLDDMPAVMRAADIVVHASTAPEPFGLVIAEAMACGCAVIAGNQGGAAEVYRADVEAIAVAPGDARALAAAIERLAFDPELRARLGAAARAGAVARHGRERLGEALAQIYTSHETAAAETQQQVAIT